MATALNARWKISFKFNFVHFVLLIAVYGSCAIAAQCGASTHALVGTIVGGTILVAFAGLYVDKHDDKAQPTVK